MRTMSKKKQKILSITTGLILALFLLTLIIKFTIHFRPFYYVHIDLLNITESSNMTREEIMLNYDALIDYLKTTNRDELNFPTLPMSREGRIHFEDVKDILIYIDILLLFTLILSACFIAKLIQQKNLKFLVYGSLFLFLIPITLILPMALDFDRSFVIFHELFFSNDYWLLNPQTDPVINIFPQTFFMNCAIMMISLITLFSLLLFLLKHQLLKLKYFK